MIDGKARVCSICNGLASDYKISVLQPDQHEYRENMHLHMHTQNLSVLFVHTHTCMCSSRVPKGDQ